MKYVADRSLSLFGTASKNIRTMVRKMREMLQKNSVFLIIYFIYMNIKNLLTKFFIKINFHYEA